jgi:hypothetical protein
VGALSDEYFPSRFDEGRGGGAHGRTLPLPLAGEGWGEGRTVDGSRCAVRARMARRRSVATQRNAAMRAAVPHMSVAPRAGPGRISVRFCDCSPARKKCVPPPFTPSVGCLRSGPGRAGVRFCDCPPARKRASSFMSLNRTPTRPGPAQRRSRSTAPRWRRRGCSARTVAAGAARCRSA